MCLGTRQLDGKHLHSTPRGDGQPLIGGGQTGRSYDATFPELGSHRRQLLRVRGGGESDMRCSTRCISGSCISSGASVRTVESISTLYLGRYSVLSIENSCQPQQACAPATGVCICTALCMAPRGEQPAVPSHLISPPIKAVTSHLTDHQLPTSTTAAATARS